MGSRPRLCQSLSGGSLFLLDRHLGSRRKPRGHPAKSTNKDSFVVNPTVGLTIEAVLTAGEPVVIASLHHQTTPFVRFS